jgi:hypothetical protein
VVKPSIFSKEYERKMRRRKRNLIILVIACLLAIALAAIYVRGAFKDVVNGTDKIKSSISTENKNVKNNDENKKTSSIDKSKSADKNTQKGKNYKIELSDGKSVNLVYQGDGNDKKYKSVTPGDGSVAYDISPSAKNVVLFDSKSQSMLLVDINGNKQDVTNTQYVSTSGSVITKDAQIAANPSYIWCSSPKFLDDNNIAYISQLPWIGKTSKYVWIENIQSKNHIMVQNIQGEDIKFQGLTEKGLTVIEDGVAVYVNASGSVTQ